MSDYNEQLRREKMYKEQYYANHGEYPPNLLFSCIYYLFVLPCKGIFYTFPKFLWSKGKIGKVCFIIYIITLAVLILSRG